MSGTIEPDVFYQDETWTDAAGVEHRIADMSPRYCRNVVAFLRRGAAEIADAVSGRLLCVGLPDDHTQAHIDVTRSLDAELERLAAGDPLEWLNGTPLLAALQLGAAREVAR